MTELPYLVGHYEWMYPSAGDAEAPVGTKILILTKGGVAVVGVWRVEMEDIAWLPLPRRNKDKEKRL